MKQTSLNVFDKRQSMKLLFVYRFCGLGGVETSILNKLEALRRQGIEGYVLFSEFYGAGVMRLPNIRE